MSTSKATIENVLVQSPVSSSKGQRYKTFLTSLLDDNVALHADWSEAMTKIHFAVTKSLENSKLLMPSALVNILLQNADELLSDVPLRTDLCALIEVCIPGEICEKSLIDIFIADYAFGLVKSILKYYADSLKEGCQSEPEREDVELTDEDKEVVHYVGGAVLRAFHRRSKQFPNSAGWKNIGRAISEKLLESDFVPGPPACVKAWTAAQDRGGLFNISGALFIFFSGVVQILKRTTEVTRINHEKVIEEVCSGAVLLLWDEALGDALSENQSYSLMCGFVRSFSNTYGRGHAKKLINEYKTKGEASVPLRHNVAPRN